MHKPSQSTKPSRLCGKHQPPFFSHQFFADHNGVRHAYPLLLLDTDRAVFVLCAVYIGVEMGVDCAEVL